MGKTQCLTNYLRVIHIIRSQEFSTSSQRLGKRNFRKFIIPSRGTEIFKHRQKTSPDPDIPKYKTGVREVGFMDGDDFVEIPEKIPELIVPDLTGFQLKPYVSYRVSDVVQSEFTAKDLFDAVYSAKIIEDFKAQKLDENGDPLEPSENETLMAEDAITKARQTGSDIFTQRSRREEEEKYYFYK